jgi:3-methyladenine DNA glycosylase AlkD
LAIELPSLDSLTAKFRRLYDKRRLENMTTYGLRDAEASLEALQWVARQVYFERCKKEMKANHPLMFDLGKKHRKANAKEASH